MGRDLFAGDCLVQPAPKRGVPMLEIFMEAGKKGEIRQKDVHSLIKTVAAVRSKKEREAEASIAALIIRRAYPTISVTALAEQFAKAAVTLTVKRPELTMVAATIIAFLLFLFPH